MNTRSYMNCSFEELHKIKIGNFLPKSKPKLYGIRVIYNKVNLYIKSKNKNS